MSLIIGIGHQRGVGKDVAARVMKDRLENGPYSEVPSVVHTGFARPLYDVCVKLYGWAGLKEASYYDVHRDEKEQILPALGKSPRDILIAMGMKAREIHESTWLDLTMLTEADIVIISDVRFPNEADAIHAAGGYLLKITRPGLPEISDPNDPDNKLASFSFWDYHINNDGGLLQFGIKIDDLVEEIKEKWNGKTI